MLFDLVCFELLGFCHEKIIDVAIRILFIGFVSLGCSQERLQHQLLEGEVVLLTSTEIEKLFHRDLDALTNADPEGLSSYDDSHHNRFKEIFSGYI